SYPFNNRLIKSLADRTTMRFALSQIFARALGCFSQHDNRRDIFPSAPASVFLAAAGDQWVKTCSATDIKRADALRSMKFVRGKGKKIDRGIPNTNRDFPNGLHGVCVKGHAFVPAEFSDFLHRK